MQAPSGVKFVINLQFFIFTLTLKFTPMPVLSRYCIAVSLIAVTTTAAAQSKADIESLSCGQSGYLRTCKRTAMS